MAVMGTTLNNFKTSQSKVGDKKVLYSKIVVKSDGEVDVFRADQRVHIPSEEAPSKLRIAELKEEFELLKTENEKKNKKTKLAKINNKNLSGALNQQKSGRISDSQDDASRQNNSNMNQMLPQVTYGNRHIK